MDYTEEGQRWAGAILLLPLLLLLLFLLLMIIESYRQKASAKYYVYDVCLWLAGIMAGSILFFLFGQQREGIMNGIVHFIREAGWLQYPVP